jgi:hypothetical protein
MSSIPYALALMHVHDATCVRVDDNELLYPDVDLEENTITIQSEHANNPIEITSAENKKGVTVNQHGELVFKDIHGNDVQILLLRPKLIKNDVEILSLRSK